jgi:DNA-binding transcriptional LysR family regulator
MEIRQLEYLVAVVEEASFTRAAARLHVAQPGVSAQVRQLERELGEPLLDRSGRTVRPTAAGSAVLPYARSALAAVAGVRLAVDELSGLLRGRVAAGMIVSCTATSLPDALAEFHQLHPGVVITLGEANSSDLLAGLASGALDLALVGLAGPPPAGIGTQVVADEPLVAAVAPDHPLAAADGISLPELAGCDLICLPQGTGARTALERACAATGTRLRVAFEASDPRVLVHLAGRGLGVALLPASIVAARPPCASPLSAVPLLGPGLRSQLALAWTTGATSGPAARALIAHARQALAAVAAPA